MLQAPTPNDTQIAQEANVEQSIPSLQGTLFYATLSAEIMRDEEDGIFRSLYYEELH